MKPGSEELAEAVRTALSRWPDYMTGAAPEECWIGFAAYDDGGYRLTVEIPTNIMKIAPNPTTAEVALRKLRVLAEQATTAADVIEAAMAGGRA